MWMPAEVRIPGGHRVQLEQTAAALRRAGHEVEIRYGVDVPSGSFDVVHGFALNPSDVRAARRTGAAVAISTIYWSRAYRFEPPELGRRWAVRHRAAQAARLASASLRAADGTAALAADLADRSRSLAFEGADVLIPNSVSEGNAVVDELGVTTPWFFACNAVDQHLGDVDAPPISERDEVLCLARIEPHKNQLALIEALRDTGLPIVVAGPDHPDHRRYADLCRAAAGNRVRVIGAVPAGEPYLELMRKARVVVLASWFETTGLATLEGAALGANVVSTSRGFSKDYFGDEAWYCDPARRRSIRDAVLAAWNHPGHPGLRKRVLESFTWDVCAVQTLQAYNHALER